MANSGIRGSISANSRLADCAKLLMELPDQYVIGDVKASQRKAWTTIFEAAQKNCPVDTGRLREMIVLKVGYNKKTQTVFANVGLRKIRSRERAKIRQKKVERKLSQTAVEYDAWYGVLIEFGTEHMKAQPFMRPAFDNHFHGVFLEYADDCKRRLELRFKKLSETQARKLIA